MEPDYKSLYFKMAAAAADAAELLSCVPPRVAEAAALLIRAQQACEEQYLAQTEEVQAK